MPTSKEESSTSGDLSISSSSRYRVDAGSMSVKTNSPGSSTGGLTMTGTGFIPLLRQPTSSEAALLLVSAESTCGAVRYAVGMSASSTSSWETLP